MSTNAPNVQQEMPEADDWVTPLSVGQYNGEPVEEWLPPPPGIYHFRCIKKDRNTLVAARFNDTGTKEQAKFYFEIIDHPNPALNGMEIRQFFTISLNEKANLRPFMEAMKGMPLLPTDKMGWKDGVTAEGQQIVGIFGKTFTASLTHYTNQAGRTYARLVGPVPYVAGSARGGTQPPAPKLQPSVPEEPEYLDDVPF